MGGGVQSEDGGCEGIQYDHRVITATPPPELMAALLH